MKHPFLQHLQQELNTLREAGLYKEERIITSPQGADISLQTAPSVINFCANNYLGLCNHPAVKKSAEESLSKYGFGLASVRFICGTQNIHIELEDKISRFLGTEGTLLYSSCFDANGGLFETLLGAEDAVISDALNHASIIDGIRLSKAKRFRYRNNDMQDLEEQLKQAASCRFKLIATDGVFSMDGIIANLPAICDLAEKYGALVMVDDSHAVGFLGDKGGGTPEYWGVSSRIDILTGTFGKALGGASGGYTSGHKEIIEWLRQRSRPYLFSNTLAPTIVVTTLAILDLLEKEGEGLRKRLFKNAEYFRSQMNSLGFHLGGKDHPIIPVMLVEAKLTQLFAKKMLAEGIYVIGFFYPVVPEGAARIRVQISAAHTTEEIDQAIQAFKKVGKELGVIK